jgi:hypothetical protein
MKVEAGDMESMTSGLPRFVFPPHGENGNQ